MAIVKSAQVDELPQQFDAGLRSKELERRHVDIINEHAYLLEWPRSEECLSLLDEFAFDGQLHILGLGLC